jgi:hypothetical protein
MRPFGIERDAAWLTVNQPHMANNRAAADGSVVG